MQRSIACLDKIPHQNISADALEDTSAPKSKEADEGAKVGRVDVLHVRHRHLLNLVASVATGDYVRFFFLLSCQLLTIFPGFES